MAKIVVADDNPDIRMILQLTLMERGSEIVHAADGVAALAAVEAEAPELLILDVEMPGVDGFGVLGTMRARGWTAHTRVLVLTSRTDERDFLRGWELGADEYLTKPFDPEQLLAKVDELLAASPESLHARRVAESEKAALLDQVESAFHRTPRPA